MTVDLILHGVPNGQDIWGVSNDTHYFSTFYVQKDEKELLSIETRKVSGKSYCYYNYLKYNSVTASDGRAGAYIGITLRFDAYYKNILNVYHLCEIVYNNLLDTILIKNGENVKFEIAKFEDAEDELVEIKKKIFNLINLSATAKDFTPINDSFFSNDSKTVKAFLLDCTPDNVMQAIIKYGKVEISKYYQSINEAKKLKSLEERHIATIAKKDEELQISNRQTEYLRLEQNRLQNELENKNDKIRELNMFVSEKENIIRKNEKAVLEANILKQQIQELNSQLESQNREIEAINAKLIEYKSNQPSSMVGNNKRHSHKRRTQARERQLSSVSNEYNDYDSNNHYEYSTKATSFFEKISCLGSFPLWQIITIVIITLALLSLSIVCVVKTFSSNDNEPKVEQTSKVSYIKNIEDCYIDADYGIKDIDDETRTNTDNDDNYD